MTGLTAIRIAALLAIGYAVWVLAGGAVHFGAGSESVSLRLNFANPIAWLIALLALAIGFGLWMRFAWAWWLGLAAALFQGWRILDPFVRSGLNRIPGTTTLLVLLLLITFIVLLFMPKARASCNR